jgi:ABC-type uncharacterized transport system involved in gliding motility auxiliary subunit
VAFLDPLSYVESQSMPQQQRFQMAAQGGSNLEKLLKAWGLSFDASKVMADLQYKTPSGRGGQTHPAVLTLPAEAINTNDVVTSQINNLLMLFPGAFSGTPVAGLTQTILAHTSTEAGLIDRFMAEFSGENSAKDVKPDGKEHPLAIRLVGKFKTAFPDGAPKDTTPPAEGEKKEEKPAGDGLKESKTDTVVILVADTDMLYDQFAVRMGDLMGQRIIMGLANGNLPLVQNVVEQLSGDNNLIAIRSRASQNRPFTRVREMEAQANKKLQARIDELQKSVADTQNRLQELQRTKEGQGNQRFIISPEQQAEIEKLRKKQAEVNRDLKQERKNLRRDVDALETRLKYGNIFGMPLLVTVAGISLAVFKRKKTAAR